jgi:cyclophilin family peptidyl-prolyl cis-trans isomerase
LAANDKRARKKQFRDEAAAVREAELRKRRLVRFGVLGLVVLGVITWALLSGKDTDQASDNQNAAETIETNAPTEEPSAAPEGVACDGEEPPASDPKQYDKPEQVMEPGVDYAAVLHTSCGDIEIDLLEEKAPDTVNSFIFLSKEGFYDGLTFHRIVSGFVIQGGDPEGTGQGGPGYVVKDEFPKEGNEYIFGTVAMANAGPNTTGSQFFIVVHEGAKGQTDEPVGLDPLYSLFGEATEDSYEVIKEIAKVETGGPTGESPVVPVYINSIEIIER